MLEEKLDSITVELDCSEQEAEELKRRVHLLAFGNGEDLCILTCDAQGCRQARLIIRPFENISEKGRMKFTNGGIEINCREHISNFLANNLDGCWYDIESEMVSLHYGRKGLLVVIKWNGHGNGYDNTMR